MNKCCPKPKRSTCRYYNPLILLSLVAAGCGPFGLPPDATPPTDTGGTNTPVIIRFDGAETTTPGTTNFTFMGATFTGGTVKTVGQPQLYGSGLFAYEVRVGSTVVVTFSQPVDLLQLFFVKRGTGQTMLMAFGQDGSVVGSISANPSGGSASRQIPLSATATRVEVTHTGDGDGWIDDFTFRFADTNGT